MPNQIQIALAILTQGKTILYPTDTVWGIGCDATNKLAVAKIFKIKKRNESKSLVILVDSFEMLGQYIDEIPETVKLYLSKSKSPVTVIYSFPKGLPNNVISDDDTVAIRIVQDAFCKDLIHEFGKPIVSTSANISGNQTPHSFSEIVQSVLDSVDYIVDLHKEKKNRKASSIIKINPDNSIDVIRD